MWEVVTHSSPNIIPSACIRFEAATKPRFLRAVYGIAHAHLPTATTGLDDARHRGWAWK
jgi:hypothetical protein